MTIETSGGNGQERYAPIVDANTVLGRKEIFITVEKCRDRNSAVYCGGESSQGHG